MANPQKEHGYVQVANDLFVALLSDDTGSHDRIVLAEAYIQCYGQEKRAAAEIDPAILAALTGLDVREVRRALRRLVAGRRLLPLAGGTYRIGKDYEAWGPAGRGGVWALRLAGGLLRYARSTLIRRGAAGGGPASPPEGLAGPERGLASPLSGPKKGLASPLSGPKKGLASPSPRTPIEERARVQTLRVSDSIDPPYGDAGAGEGDDEPFAGMGTGPTGGPPAVRGEGADSPEGIALAGLAEALGYDTRGMSYAELARDWCGSVPCAWIARLLRDHVQGQGMHRKPVVYLIRILHRWQEQGRCDATRAEAGHAAAPGPHAARPRRPYLDVLDRLIAQDEEADHA